LSNTTNKKKIAQLIIARLDSKDINKKFKYYQSLVKNGVAGFIVFGGRLKEVSKAIKRLQNIAEIPLFIASDLEQGLGQQIKGGTLFPPAMAIAQAINPKSKHDIRLLRKTINIIAQETKAAGINVIFSPVLDVNTNHRNPIICTRAFSDNPREVAWFGKEFIKGFQRHGLLACAKHFPGHGDTSVDSHRELPVVKADLKRLYDVELYPFTQAIKAGVKMIMIGHLKVPVIDQKFPSSLSPKIIQGLLREKMRFKGLVITDAMNMKAIKFREEEACLRGIKAGADIILHPSNPEKVIDYLASKWEEVEQRIEESYQRVLKAKEGLNRVHGSQFTVHSIGTKSNWDLAYELTRKSITPSPTPLPRGEGVRGRVNPLVLIIDDDNNKSGTPFVNALKKRYKNLKTFYVDNNSSPSVLKKISKLRTPMGRRPNSELIIAVFSKVSAFKGRSGLSSKLHGILEKAVRTSRYSVLVGFCCPYILREFHKERAEPTYEVGKVWAVIEAFSDSELTQKAVGKILCGA
jgi:beta-glucosidase-like glycosyl hydrolase